METLVRAAALSPVPSVGIVYETPAAGNGTSQLDLTIVSSKNLNWSGQSWESHKGEDLANAGKVGEH
jgi:hypothetical protein